MNLTFVFWLGSISYGSIDVKIHVNKLTKYRSFLQLSKPATSQQLAAAGVLWFSPTIRALETCQCWWRHGTRARECSPTWCGSWIESSSSPTSGLSACCTGTSSYKRWVDLFLTLLNSRIGFREYLEINSFVWTVEFILIFFSYHFEEIFSHTMMLLF